MSTSEQKRDDCSLTCLLAVGVFSLLKVLGLVIVSIALFQALRKVIDEFLTVFCMVLLPLMLFEIIFAVCALHAFNKRSPSACLTCFVLAIIVLFFSGAFVFLLVVTTNNMAVSATFTGVFLYHACVAVLAWRAYRVVSGNASATLPK
ncbi:MARVEL domain-containing protein [Plasmodiophora brassicae]